MTTDVLQLELRMNVAALKRVDPYLKDILESASHVALYAFNGENNEWEKTEIEGALFVYSRMGEPYHSILIMNRLNTKNQVEPISQGLDLQLQEPFLLYKNGKGDIYGIWFYDRDECMRISLVLNRLAKESSDTSNKTTPKNKKTYQKKNNNVDIFSMLSKAQEAYNSNKSSSSEKSNRRMDPKSPMTNAIGELSGALSAMAMAPDGTSKSVMDFFAKAKVNTGHFKTGEQPQSGNGDNESKPLLARLMSHPAAHTVEHIEKQHRTITPQPINQNSQSGMVVMNNQSCEKPLTVKPQKEMHQGNPNAQSNRIYSQEYSSSTLNTNTCNNIANTEDMNMGFLRIQSPTAGVSNNIANQYKTNSNIASYGDSCEQIQKQSNPISGNAFDSMFHHSSMSNVHDDLITTPLTPKSSTLTTSGTALALIPPGMFAATASPAAPEPLRQVEPLTRNQLMQAFNYLLRTDPEFINKLHEAYVKSFSEILS